MNADERLRRGDRVHVKTPQLRGWGTVKQWSITEQGVTYRVALDNGGGGWVLASALRTPEQMARVS